MRRRTFLPCLPLLPTLGVPTARAEPERAVQSLAAQAFESGLLPGLQLALVGPEGLRCSAELGPGVRADSRFYLASTTKTFTALALAQGAERGGIGLDATLDRLLPFVAWRPEIGAERIRLRDLLAHGHGLDADSVPAHLRIAFSGDYQSNAQMLGWLADLRPAAQGRAFAYGNLGPDLAAMAAAPDGRDGWKALVQQEVLDRLGLRHCSPWHSRLPPAAVMRPHEPDADGEGWRPLPANKLDANMGAAGGLYGTAQDLGRLAQALLNQGRLDGAAHWSAGVQRGLMQVEQVQQRRWLDQVRHGYSLGLDLATVDGEPIATRMGDFRGWCSHFSFMPGRGLGLALLVNGGGVAAAAAHALAQAIYRQQRGDAAHAREGLAARLVALREALQASRRQPAPPPSTWPVPAPDLAGRYADDQLGEMRLVEHADGMALHWGVLQSEFVLRDPERGLWRVDWSGQGRWVAAERDATGRVSALQLMGRTLRRVASARG